MILSRSSRFLDGKECLKVWCESGSCDNAVLVFEQRGLINPNTKRPPTRMAIWLSAWRWVLNTPENLAYAREKYFEPLALNEGLVRTEDEWGIWFIKHARLVHKNRYQRFLASHPELAKYDKIAE